MIDSQFRLYSRRVIQHPNNINYHQKRIDIAQKLTANEPLQGALVDMFYGCWFEMPYIGHSILINAKNRLQSNVYKSFEQCILKKDYIQKVSVLATRWSVLVAPSLNVASHNLLTSSDNARQLANEVVVLLLINQKLHRFDRIAEIEEDFFAHCIACQDLIAFTITWFKLAKEKWDFDKRWMECQEYLERKTKYTNYKYIHE